MRITELPPEQVAVHVPNAHPEHRIFASVTEPPRYVISKVFPSARGSDSRSFNAEGVWDDLEQLNVSLTPSDVDPGGTVGDAAHDANFSGENAQDHYVEVEVNHPGLLDPTLRAMVTTMFEQSMGKPA